MEIKKNNGVLYIKTQKKDKKIMSQALMDEKQFLANQRCGMEAEGTEMFMFKSVEALKKALTAAESPPSQRS